MTQNSDDALSEAAAARLRGQLDLFPLSLIKAHGNNEFSIRVDRFRDAVEAVKLREGSNEVLPEMLATKEADELTFMLEGRTNGIRIFSQYRGFRCWAALLSERQHETEVQTIGAIVSQHFLAGLQSKKMIRDEGPISLTVDLEKGQIEDNWGSTSLEMSAVAPRKRIPQELAEQDRWKVDPRALRGALFYANHVSRVAERPRPLHVREDGIYAGGINAFVRVRCMGLPAKQIQIERQAARRLHRVMARMEPQQCFLYELDSSLIFDDALIGCAFDKTSEGDFRFPEFDLPNSHAFSVHASDLALRGPI